MSSSTHTDTRRAARSGTAGKVAVAGAVAGLSVLAPATPGDADMINRGDCIFGWEVHPERVYGGANAYVEIMCEAATIGTVHLVQETSPGVFTAVASSGGFHTSEGRPAMDNAFLAYAPPGVYRARLDLFTLGVGQRSYLTDHDVLIK